MRVLARATMLSAGVHMVGLTVPRTALGDGAAQPVHYGNATVPYGQPAPAPSAPAARSATGEDVVYLKSGGLLRGTLIDAIPNAQARIQLATGEIATVPWQEIQRIEQSSGARGESGTAAPPAAAKAAAGPSVFVHVDADDVNLEQETPSGAWTMVCSAPCNRLLPTDPRYRVDGGGIKASNPFTLSAQGSERETIGVNGASKGWFVTGIVAVSVGGVVTLVGLFVGLAGSIASAADSAVNQSTSGADQFANAGWTMAGVGALAVVAGIVMIVSNAHTTVSQDLMGPRAAAAQLLPGAWARAPVWRESPPGLTGPAPIPAPWSALPILTGRF